MPARTLVGCILGCLLLAPAAVQGQPSGGQGIKAQLPKIIKLLENPNAKVRKAAAFALGNMGPDAYGALEALVLASADGDQEVVKTIKDAITKIAGGSSGGSATTPPTTNAAKGTKGSYKIAKLAVNPDAKENLMHHQKVEFTAGTTVTIQVKSKFTGDVDLYVDDPSGKQVAQDTSVSKDCLVTLTITQTGTYTLVVDNLGKIENECEVTYEAK
jgi:plastocyanin